MSTDIVMPKLSDTMEEGKILKWLKQVGDTVAAGEVIAEVETDKADMELEAEAGGVLEAIQVPEGQSAAVGAVIALVAEAGAGAGATTPKDGASPRPKSAAKPEPRAASVTPETEPVADHASDDRPAVRRPATPVRGARAPAAGLVTPKASAAARALATERGIDLASVAGTGPDGRITSADVEEASTHGREADVRGARTPAREREAPVAERHEPVTERHEPVTERHEPVTERHELVTERHELSRMRQSIARRMSEAFRDIPHFSVTAVIDMSEAVRLKGALEKTGTFEAPVTYTHMVLRAVARALTRHPRLNASYRDGALEVHAEVNLGMAVSVDDGLIVPVIRHADERSLADIAAEARRLVALTKQGRFASADLSGGTFTVSNMGMLDIEAFTAVINPPQAAILAVGAIKQRAVVRDGAVAAAHTMFVTVSCDHRIIDGVMAGRFLEELKTLLENPIGLVVS